MSDSEVETENGSVTDLLARLQLRFVHRSPRSMWLGKPMHVKFELSVAHLRINMHQVGKDSSSNNDDNNSSTRSRASSASSVSSTKHPKQKLHRELAWRDVLGAHILTHNGEHVNAPIDFSRVKKTETYMLGVFACPSNHLRKDKVQAGARKKRHLLELFYQFQGDQLQDVNELCKWINFLADPRTESQLHKVQSVFELTPEERPARKFLALINPVGGAGKGVQTYENKVAPVLKYAGIDVKVEITKRAGHATEIITDMPLNVYDCVLSVGGDGSLSEITQGLMTRPDWNHAIRQPIGIIPSGSGNGLSHSMLYQSEEKAKPINAAFALAKGSPHEIDIASVRNGKETMYSFLSFEWAAIADVDMQSEKLRVLGGLRFGVTFVHHIFLTKNEYPGTLWYLEDDPEQAMTEPPRYFETHDPNSTEYPKLDLIDCDPNDKTKLGGTWKEVKSHFRILWVMSITHASYDAIVAPEAQLDDGYNYITYVDGSNFPRSELLPVLLAMEDGSHIKRDSVHHVRTRAWKLVPDRPDDALCVDGELFPGPMVESQVHRGFGRVMTLPRTIE